jgi:glycosyltransferase involved in cell wall biosynthesis
MAAGHGAYRKALQEAMQIRQQAEQLGIEDSVIFTGVRQDVPALLSTMDVMVFPSFYEGMPNTVIEAQATGLPCLIADTITKEANITGLVEYLPLENAEGWAEKALSIINTERVDTKDSFVSNRYDIKSVVDDFSRIIFDFQ